MVVGIGGAAVFDRAFNQSVAQTEGAIRMIDPIALVLIIVSIIVVALVACAIPIRRATTVDPVDTLRSA